MMKYKTTAVCALLLALLLLFAACGQNDSNGSSEAEQTSVSEENAEASPATTAAQETTRATTDAETTAAQETSAPETTQPDGAQEDEPEQVPLFELAAQAETARAGDTYTISITALPYKNVACFDLLLEYDPNVLQIETVQQGQIESFIIDDTKSTDNFKEGRLAIRCLTATTLDMNGETIETIRFTVSSDAPAADTEIRLSVQHYFIGEDASGSTIADIMETPELAGTVTLHIEEE